MCTRLWRKPRQWPGPSTLDQHFVNEVKIKYFCQVWKTPQDVYEILSSWGSKKHHSSGSGCRSLQHWPSKPPMSISKIFLQPCQVNLLDRKCHHVCGSTHTCEATAWGHKRCREGNGFNHNKGSVVKVLTRLMCTPKPSHVISLQ